ncbi:MAG: hypothetical protein HFJ29_05390 [Clostridia bacterium]|nr:hypothetical protein [Clostridia bacterium]
MEEIKEFIMELKKKGVKSGEERGLDEKGKVVIPIELRKDIIGIAGIKSYKIEDLVIVEILDKILAKNEIIDELGRVSIKSDYRKELAWREKDVIEIWRYDNYIILKKKEDKCVFCKREMKLKEDKGKRICDKCKKELVDKINNGQDNNSR